MMQDENIDYYQSGRYLNHLKKRYRTNRIFYFLGFSAVFVSLLFLGYLLLHLFFKGIPAFTKTDLAFSLSEVQSEEIKKESLTEQKLYRLLYTDLKEKVNLSEADFNAFISPFTIPDILRSKAQRREVSLRLLASDNVDQYIKHPEQSHLPERQQLILAEMKEQGVIIQKLNLDFFTSPDSREAEEAGIAGAFLGSIMLIMITALFCIPVGIGAAIYLEEFAPKNKIIDFIEVNINNLAAVPSIVFGLLGLSVFINYLHFPRSTPLIGGIVLSLMTLPPLIMNARLAIQNVPSSIRQASLGLGASPVQVILHHILPLSLPGIMTGTIIGLARALGETAPLLMIGMVAFIADTSFSPLEASTALPVQIYMWANSPEPGFIEKSSGAILVLLFILLIINLIAMRIRQKFEKEWS